MLLQKLESDLNQALQNKIFSHYYSFSQFLSLLNSYETFSKSTELDKKKEQYSEYINHLEKKIAIQEKTLRNLIDKYKHEKQLLKKTRNTRQTKNQTIIKNGNETPSVKYFFFVSCLKF